jgi:hypothetical protein
VDPAMEGRVRQWTPPSRAGSCASDADARIVCV